MKVVGWDLEIGKILGFPIRLNATLLLWIVFLGWIANQTPTEEIAYQRSIEAQLRILRLLPMLIVAVLVHELGHGVACRWLGFGSGVITLWAFGGYFLPFSWQKAQTEMTRSERQKFIVMILAGPLSNVLLAVIGKVIDLSNSTPYMNEFVTLNLSLALFNLLPIPRLDGGQILLSFGLDRFRQQKVYQAMAGILLMISISMIIGAISNIRWADRLINISVYSLLGTFSAWQLSKKSDIEILEEYRNIIKPSAESNRRQTG